MPGLRAGAAYVDLLPRVDRSFEADAERQVDGPLRRIGGRVAGAGSRIAQGLAVGLAGAFAAGGAGLLAAGQQIDDALDNIRIRTGATGDELAGLEQSFRNVGREAVGVDLGQVSDAVADLAARTGLVGAPLEALSVQMLNLSRLTGQDLATTIEQSTRLFGDWGVAVDQQGPALDRLYALSQQTGVGVDFMAERLVQFGGPLRQLGFGMEESAALIARFQQEGVNTELVLGSMRQALGRMARAGEAPAETLRRVMAEIQNAGTAGEANATALELFGARAGPDMAAAIREGRFAVDDLIGSLGDTGGAIASAAADTDGFSEKFARLRNRIMLAVEPLATRLVEALDTLADRAGPVVEAIGARLPGAFEAVGRFAEPLVDIARDVGDALSAFFYTLRTGFTEDEGTPIERFALFVRDTLWPILQRVGAFIGDNLRPILIGLGAAFALITAPVTTVIAALVAAYFRFEGFRRVVDAVVRFLVGTVGPAIAEIASYIAEQFGNLVGWVREHWDSISEAIGHVVNVIEGVISAFVEVVSWVWRNFGDTIMVVISSAWENVKAVVEAAINIVRGIIETVVALINGDWGAAWDAIVGILDAAWELVKTVVGNAIEFVKTLIGDGMEVASGLVSGALDSIVGFFSGLGDRIGNAAGDVFGFLWDSFRSAVNFIIDAWNGLEFSIPGFDPPGPGPSFGGVTIGTPNIPRLAKGGGVHPFGTYVVGDGGGPELLQMGSIGGRVFPYEDLAGALAGQGAAGVVFEAGAVVVEGGDFTAEEAVDAVNTKLGWKLTTRRDR